MIVQRRHASSTGGPAPLPPTHNQSCHTRTTSPAIKYNYSIINAQSFPLTISSVAGGEVCHPPSTVGTAAVILYSSCCKDVVLHCLENNVTVCLSQPPFRFSVCLSSPGGRRPPVLPQASNGSINLQSVGSKKQTLALLTYS